MFTNEELKSRLTTPGTKNNLQYPTQLRLYFEENAGFTDEELTIFRLRARGFGVVEISFIMQERYGAQYPSGLYGCEKVERRIRRIKDKMAELL